MGISWEHVENACPENLELAAFIRELARLHGGGAPVDWGRLGARCSEILFEFHETHEGSLELTRHLQGAQYEVGGDEHHLVEVSDQPERLFKLTHSDCFGCYPYFSMFDPDLMGKHFHATCNDDPIFYARRWMILNFIGGFRTRFEGVIPPQDRMKVPRICISQPQLGGGNPDRSRICQGLSEYGFEAVSEDAFIHFGTGILLTDAAPRNVRIVNGVTVPFDAIATIANDRTLKWALQRCQGLIHAVRDCYA